MPVIRCGFCDDEFTKLYANQKYCNQVCAHKANKPVGNKFVILARDNFRCFYCGRASYEHNLELHIDHVVPENKGGESKARNLVTACVNCNKAKHTTVLEATESILAEVSRRNVNAGIPANQTFNLGS